MDGSGAGGVIDDGGPFLLRTGEHAGGSREAVLIAAIEVIAERGFESSRFSDISEKCGVPINTLQYQFGSREDLLHAAFQYLAFQELGEMAEAMRAGPDPWLQLRRLMEISMMENGDTEIVWRAWVEFWRAAIRDPRVREEATEVYRQWRGFVEQVVRTGVAQGRFSVDLDPQAVALQISAVVDGMAVPLVTGDSVVHDLRSPVTGVVVDAIRRIVGLQPVKGSDSV